MDWILIGIVGGSLVISGFSTKEACLGRVATLKEQKVEAKCVEAPGNHLGLTGTGTICLWGNNGQSNC
jgi:hypothetical protein